MFNYDWNLKDGYSAKGIKKHKTKVFTTFACGGGSSMGYKLAGYDVIGANDIDSQMKSIYIKNHNPKYFLLQSISDIKIKDLPNEIKEIDVLDGSPPCSTFSISGLREKSWKKDKHFREGQAKQILSDLFFDFISFAKELKPKFIIAENVKGMLLGNARAYTKAVFNGFKEAGYTTQIFLLNSATMGVPQKRERVFFISHRNDLNLPKLKMNFNEKPIVFSKIDDGIIDNYIKIRNCDEKYIDICQPGNSIASVNPDGNFFNSIKMHPLKVPNTLASGSTFNHPKQKRQLTTNELRKISSFPSDYNYLDIKPKYVMGMSVPPVMMANVANELYKQWITKIQ